MTTRPLKLPWEAFPNYVCVYYWFSIPKSLQAVTSINLADCNLHCKLASQQARALNAVEGCMQCTCS